jgi:hypothetical protein
LTEMEWRRHAKIDLAFFRAMMGASDREGITIDSDDFPEISL